MRSAYRFFIAVFAIIFVSVQANAVAHAAQFGDGPHQHDGMVCEVQAISAEQDVIEPLVAVPSVTHFTTSAFYATPYISASYVIPPGRAPPPRSPPFILI